MNALAKPEGQTWEKAILKKVWLTDECPTIGSGVRHVWVVIGTKHVKIAGPFGARARMLVRDFNHVVMEG